jgi:hypothetical protein
MEAQHNETGYFASKVDFIAAELRRLQCALEGRINAETGEIDCNVEAVQEIPVVRLGVDLRLQLGPFSAIDLENAAPCGSVSTTTSNALQATKYFPKMPMDFFIGGFIVDNNVHVYQVDPDALVPNVNLLAEKAAARTVAPAPKAVKKGRKTEADGGSAVAPEAFEPCEWSPIEIPPTHPFLAKASIEFIDNALLVTETDSEITCEECPNVYKSMPVYKHMTQPVLLRSIPSETTPLPAGFEWSDLPGVGNDELLCYCQGERLIIEEMSSSFGSPPTQCWSNFIGDADGIPASPHAGIVPAVMGLHALVTAEAVIYARADSLIDTFCCPTQITPEVPSCEDVDLEQRAPFQRPTAAILAAAARKKSLQADGGMNVKDIVHAAERALSDPGRPFEDAYSVRVKGPVAPTSGLLRRRIVPRRIA